MDAGLLQARLLEDEGRWLYAVLDRLWRKTNSRRRVRALARGMGLTEYVVPKRTRSHPLLVLYR